MQTFYNNTHTHLCVRTRYNVFCLRRSKNARRRNTVSQCAYFALLNSNQDSGRSCPTLGDTNKCNSGKLRTCVWYIAMGHMVRDPLSAHKTCVSFKSIGPSLTSHTRTERVSSTNCGWDSHSVDLWTEFNDRFSPLLLSHRLLAFSNPN